MITFKSFSPRATGRWDEMRRQQVCVGAAIDATSSCPWSCHAHTATKQATRDFPTCPKSGVKSTIERVLERLAWRPRSVTWARGYVDRTESFRLTNSMRNKIRSQPRKNVLHGQIERTSASICARSYSDHLVTFQVSKTFTHTCEIQWLSTQWCPGPIVMPFGEIVHVQVLHDETADWNLAGTFSNQALSQQMQKMSCNRQIWLCTARA